MSLSSTASQSVSSEDKIRLSLSRLGQVPLHSPTRTSSSGHVQRRRFIRDGEVPTVYTSRGSERSSASLETAEKLAEIQAELARERVARTEAETLLDEVRVTARNLQTRLGHMELELQELRERADHGGQAAGMLQAETKAKPGRVSRISKPVAKRAATKQQPVKWWLKQGGRWKGSR